MTKIIERKCWACKNTMQIDRYNVQDVILYKSKYYHKQCFIEYATRLSQSKRATAREWVKALEDIEIYEKRAKSILETCKPSDKLNDWILDHYNIVSTAGFENFWRSVGQLQLGKYHHKACQKIPTQSLYEAWMWAQHNLDKINTNNKMKNKHIEGEARLNYDLKIIVNKYPIFLKWKDKQKAAAAAAAVQETQKTKINYSNLEKQNLESKKDTNSIDDISDLLDELF